MWKEVQEVGIDRRAFTHRANRNTQSIRTVLHPVMLETNTLAGDESSPNSSRRLAQSRVIGATERGGRVVQIVFSSVEQRPAR